MTTKYKNLILNSFKLLTNKQFIINPLNNNLAIINKENISNITGRTSLKIHLKIVKILINIENQIEL